MNTSQAPLCFTAEDMHAVMRDHNVDPTVIFRSVAGRDYGEVFAWEVSKRGYLIECRRPEGAKMHFASNINDLGSFLLAGKLDPFASILRTANILGADHIPDASPDQTGPFYVLITRSWCFEYNTETFESDLVKSFDVDDKWMAFPTYADAEAFIAEAKNHYQAARANPLNVGLFRNAVEPTYKIVVPAHD